MKNAILLITFLAFFVSCEETTVGNNSNTNIVATDVPPNNKSSNTEENDPNNDIDVKVEGLGKDLDFSEFNTLILESKKAGEEWVASPLSIMLKFTGAGMDSNVKSIRSKKLSPGESINEVMVTVEEDGLMDDSVSGTMSFLRMKKTDGVWQVYKATQAWKCWKGRGHETYGVEPCN